MDTNAPTTPPPPPPPPPPAAPPRAHRPLRRDRANGMLGGVAAGIAGTYGIDVLLVRVLFVVAGVLWIGIPAYIVAWIAIAPADGPPTFAPGRRDPKMILGLALVALGALIAGDRVLPHGFGFGHFGAPLLLIGGGLAILLLRRRDDQPPYRERPPATPPAPPDVSPTDAAPGGPEADGPAEAPTPPPTGTGADPEPPATATAGAAASAAPVTEPTPTVGDAFPFGSAVPFGSAFPFDSPPPPPPTGPLPPPSPVPPTAWTQTAPWPSVPSARAQRRASRYERRVRRPRPFLTPLTLSVLLIGAGVASLLQATGALDVNLTVVLALGTGVVGVALVTGAFAGRAHALILVGLLLLGATAIANTIDVPLRGGIGDRTYRPIHVDELQDHYRLGIGKLELDLRDVPLAGRTTVVDAQTGIGELRVLVPSTVRVEVHAHSGAGAVNLYGHESGGWPENDEQAIDGTGTGVLQLDLRVGAGEVTVRRYEPDGLETTVGGNG